PLLEVNSTEVHAGTVHLRDLLATDRNACGALRSDAHQVIARFSRADAPGPADGQRRFAVRLLWKAAPAQIHSGLDARSEERGSRTVFGLETELTLSSGEDRSRHRLAVVGKKLSPGKI